MVLDAGVCLIDMVIDMLCIVIVFSLNLEFNHVKLNWNKKKTEITFNGVGSF